MATTLCTAISAAATIGSVILTGPLLRLMNTPEDIFDGSYAYLVVIFIGIGATVFYNLISGIIRALGDSRTPLIFLIIASILNIVLDFIFILWFGMGVAGAAWATGISKVFSTLLMFWHFSVGPFRYLTLRRRNLRIDWHYLCAMSAIGLSPLILQSINSVLNALINTTLLRNGGDKAVASMTCISTIIMLIMIPTFGVMMGYQPIVGYNYGAEQFRRVAQTLKGAFLMSEIMTLFLYIPVMIFAPAVVGWFCNGDPDVVPMAAHGLRVFFLLFPLWPIFCIGSNFFQATGRPRKTIFLTIFRNGVCFLGSILILPRFFALDGVWATAPIADGIAALFIFFLLYLEFRQLRHKEAHALRRRNSAARGPAVAPEM